MKTPKQRRSDPGRGPHGQAGFSLTELLIASGIALTVMAAVATLFGVVSRSASQSQSTVDLSARMRATAWKLRQDLDGITCPVEPWLTPEADAGYFEISEGPQRDTTLTYNQAANAGTSNLEADTDDILMFTTRAPAGNFSGRFGTADRIIESPYAEVAWFCRESANQPAAGTKVYNLHRRQLLVLGYLGLPRSQINTIFGTLPAIYEQYDVSLRMNVTELYPNTLGDLTKRENRFMHATAFPHRILTDPLDNVRLPVEASFSQTSRDLEDVVLTNVISFDVRVFDPQAKAQASGSVTFYPGDPRYDADSATGAAGAYVDLGWGGGAATAIASGTTWPPAGQTAFQTAGMRVGNATSNSTLPVAIYDTWSLHYEFNGLNEDGDSLVDEGTNGVDNDTDDQPDNRTEYETSPPYPVPLEGIEVRIRCYDPSSKQVRQVSLRNTFRRP
jgi:type II secretory pathway pseudopilin PulG